MWEIPLKPLKGKKFFFFCKIFYVKREMLNSVLPIMAISLFNNSQQKSTLNLALPKTAII